VNGAVIQVSEKLGVTRLSGNAGSCNLELCGKDDSSNFLLN